MFTGHKNHYVRILASISVAVPHINEGKFRENDKVVPCSSALTLSLPLTTQEAFLESVDQDQTAQNRLSDL